MLPEWLQFPIKVDASISPNPSNEVVKHDLGLDAHLLKALQKMNVSNWFPVQEALIPILLAQPASLDFDSHSKGSYQSGILNGDVCVAAQTGSGKTLAYALPIVQKLLKRVVPRVRALIVVPTRDLASQVKDTFADLVKGTNLVVAMMCGHLSFAVEQSLLVQSDDKSSKVDILIATPGRLLDHLNGTPGFTLQFLEILVMDEADRLLSQSFQDWLLRVLDAIENPPKSISNHPEWAHDLLKLPQTQMDTRHWVNRFSLFPSLVRPPPRVRKVLCSATLTHQPEKMEALALYEPTFISVTSNSGESDGFVVPESLSEQIIMVESTGEKPLVLLHALLNLGYNHMLVFVKSVEAAHRLAKLINASIEKFEADKSLPSEKQGHRVFSIESKNVPSVAAFSSDLSTSDRKKLLAAFQESRVSALVCSDLMARGMDLTSGVSWVINYDVPATNQNYIHRIGRTARAGQEGTAITLLEYKQVKWFKTQTASMSRTRDVARFSSKKWTGSLDETSTFESKLVSAYQVGLGALQDSVQPKSRKSKKEEEFDEFSESEPELEEDDMSIINE